MPAEPDPRVSRGRQGSVCSRTCENRLRHWRQYAAQAPDFHREQTCERKRRYANLDEARRAVKAGVWDYPVGAYRCRWCGGAHIGGYGPRPGDGAGPGSS